MKSILVPVDFSSNSDKACRYALALANDMKAKVILLHTFDAPALYSEIPMVAASLDYNSLHDAALKKLQDYSGKIKSGAGNVEIELVVRQGLASSRITELALEKKVTLVVMGATGTSAAERVLIGSNTSGTIRNAPCMVLIIPSEATYKGMKKIIYATDLTEENLVHANKLVPFARSHNSELVFLNINTDLPDSVQDRTGIIKSEVKRLVDYPLVSEVMCKDVDVVSGIDHFIKSLHADCLAVYTHHRTLFQNLFNKSITKAVSLHTSIPLLVIHEKDQR